MINWTTVMSVLLAIAMAALAPIVLMGAIALVWFIVTAPYLLTKKLKDNDK